MTQEVMTEQDKSSRTTHTLPCLVKDTRQHGTAGKHSSRVESCPVWPRDADEGEAAGQKDEAFL